MSVANNPRLSKANIEYLISNAVSEVQYLSSGEVFMVSDLFYGYLWKRLSNYERAQVGRGFYYEYAITEKSDVNVLGKTPRNQQLYSRK